MKWKFNLYCHSTWNNTFMQLAFFPTPFFTFNPYGSFIEQGVYGKLYVISVSFLCWDFGIMIKQDNDICMKQRGGDGQEPQKN